MVPPHILDELLRRERERTRKRPDDVQPRLELPQPPRPAVRSADDEDGRGAVVIDVFG